MTNKKKPRKIAKSVTKPKYVTLDGSSLTRKISLDKTMPIDLKDVMDMIDKQSREK